MSDKKVLPIVRRIILRNKVRQFALKQIQETFATETLAQAKCIYWAVVSGCQEPTVKALCTNNSLYALNWAQGREITAEVGAL